MNTEVVESPVTIKTLMVDKNRMTKQMLKQIPIGYYIHYQIRDRKFAVLTLDSDEIDYEVERFILNGHVLGWVNTVIETKFSINNFLRTNVNSPDYSTYLIVFVDSNNELKRTFIEKKLYKLIFNDIPPQLYI